MIMKMVWELGGGAVDLTYSCASGPDAVEHVGAESDGDDEVFGVSDAHDIAGFVPREPIGAVVDSMGFTIRHLATEDEKGKAEEK